MGRGNSGEGVKQLQQFLSEQLGPQWRHNGRGLQDDGHFGPQTEAALQEFQRRNNLRPDGLLGRRTLEAIRTAPQNTLRAATEGLEQARTAAQAITSGNLTLSDASAIDAPGTTPRQLIQGTAGLAQG
jgi:murein L,D-transpeptidase YcbB/YkuD